MTSDYIFCGNSHSWRREAEEIQGCSFCYQRCSSPNIWIWLEIYVERKFYKNDIPIFFKSLGANSTHTPERLRGLYLFYSVNVHNFCCALEIAMWKPVGDPDLVFLTWGSLACSQCSSEIMRRNYYFSPH